MPTLTAKSPTPTWRLELPRGRFLDLGSPPRVMGVLNLTPDSFSDGGRWIEPQRAIERGRQMIADGADILDLGAESTRPGGGVYGRGARPVPASEQLARLLPVLEALRSETDLPISIDTRSGEVAGTALATGADLINDVSAASDERLARAVADSGCPLVVMHSRGELSTMQTGIHFDDLLREVLSDLGAVIARAESFGVERHQLIVDPGIGYGKTQAQNLALLANLDQLARLDRPILIGASRKSFISKVVEAPPEHRLGGSLAALAWATAQRCAVVRVHDVAESVQFLAVWESISEAVTARQ